MKIVQKNAPYISEPWDGMVQFMAERNLYLDQNKNIDGEFFFYPAHGNVALIFGVGRSRISPYMYVKSAKIEFGDEIIITFQNSLLFFIQMTIIFGIMLLLIARYGFSIPLFFGLAIAGIIGIYRMHSEEAVEGELDCFLKLRVHE